MTERGAEMTEHQTDKNPEREGARCTHTCTHARNKAATVLLSYAPSSVSFPCLSLSLAKLGATHTVCKGFWEHR